jgi:hypothetical protein
MSSSRPVNGNVLPSIVDPPRRCITFDIPDEPQHVAAFFGALLQLAYWFNWQRDDAHTGKDVAQVWFDVFNQASQNWLDRNCCGNCPPDTLNGGIQEDFELPIRVDCDCNVFVTCCDGSEKQILTADQVKAIAGGQPGAGSPLPAAGGGCQRYSIALPGNGRRLLPPTVSTGDTIEVTGLQGAWYDNASALWFCPTGFEYFAGVCTGVTVDNAGNFLTSAHTGTLLANIGGTYYNVSSGVFTVPSGISNAPVEMVPNTSDLPHGSGEVSMLVKVCNNQAGTWTHVFDFTTNPEGWTVQAGACGQWLPGIGFVSEHDPVTCTNDDAITIVFTLPTSIYTGFLTTIDAATVVNAALNMEINSSNQPQPAAPGTFTYSYIGTPASGDNLLVQMYQRPWGGSGQFIIKSVTLSGRGTDPF